MNCRHCQTPLIHKFVDLGCPPPSNAYIDPSQHDTHEPTYPLQVYVCDNCWLVQTMDFVKADELFSSNYAYFSSVSFSWLQHAKNFSKMIIARQQLNSSSLVVEIASNDGYLLKNFVAANIPCFGVEPTTETADAARALGIPVLDEFFTAKLADTLTLKGQQADLIIGNNVLAHVPDINDFVEGLKRLLKPSGIITMEFPHLLQLLKNNQFDTIYHEHFSYLSLHVVQQILTQHNLDIIDVEEISTHGGSLRIYVSHSELNSPVANSVRQLLSSEVIAGLQNLNTYLNFQQQIEQAKLDLVNFLSEQKRLGKKVIAYGAAAKGNTLLNFSGIGPELLPIICDAAPSKQGKLMPGSHIPIMSPEILKQENPDFILILPWNIKSEVRQQLAFLANAQFVVAIPSLQILPAV